MVNRIRQLRKEKGITMKQLGNSLGISESVVSRYETGKHQPDIATQIRLSKFFGVTVGYLIGAEDAPSSEELAEAETEQQPAQPIPAAHENGASVDQIRLQAMEIFDAIPEDRKDAALDYLRFLAAQKKD